MTTPEPPAIAVRGLSKSYGGPPVLHGLDLEMRWGEVFALFGANGSGKTTLIRILATLARPDAGEIRIGGLDPRQDPVAVRRYLGVVTHQTFLYDGLTAEENLRFYGRMFRVPNLEERVRQGIEKLRVAEYLHQRVGVLSHGTQKRLSLARALLHDPPLFLLDEPETGLDPQALALLDRLLEERKARGHAILMTTHNLERGLAVGDRVGVLEEGRIAYQEAREDLDTAALRGRLLHDQGAGR